MLLGEDNDMVQAISTDRTDEPSARDHDLFDAHPLNPSAESWTVRRVSIPQQIPKPLRPLLLADQSHARVLNLATGAAVVTAAEPLPPAG